MEYAELLLYIRRISRSVDLDSKRIEREFGISIPQFLCLRFLMDREGQQTSQKEIGDFLNLNPSTITGIIGRLEKKGLVSRLPKGDDRRVRFITLTESGVQLLQNSPDIVQQRQLAEQLRRLSGQETQELQQAFYRILNFLHPEHSTHVTKNEQ